MSEISKADGTSLESDVCIARESRHHRSSFILRIEHKTLAVDHLAVLCDGHVNAVPARGIDQLDGLGHRIGVFAAVIQRLEAKASPVHMRVLRAFFRRHLCEPVGEFHTVSLLSFRFPNGYPRARNQTPERSRGSMPS